MTDWSDPKFMHRRTEITHQISYWKDGVACSHEDATLARLEVSNGLYSQHLNIELPVQLDTLVTVERMLQVAYDRGRHAKAQEIKDALHIKEPRT